MNAYRMAFDAWESQGEGDPCWNDLLSHFLNSPGCAVVSLPGSFILARQIRADLEDDEHRRLSPLQYQGAADCWNIWLAAGNLDALLTIAKAHPLEWVSYNRRGRQEVRRVKLIQLLRRHVSQNATASTRAAPAGFRFQC